MQRQLALPSSSRPCPSTPVRQCLLRNRQSNRLGRYFRAPAGRTEAATTPVRSDKLPEASPEQHAAPEARVNDNAAEYAAPEAVFDADVKPQEPEFIDVEVTTEVEVEDLGFQPRVALQQAQDFLTNTTAGRGVSLAVVGLLVASLVVAAKRAYEKANTAEAKRRQQIDRNKKLVTELSKYLPDQRFKLKPGTIGSLQKSTGFSNVEVFRKYLWYVLRERKFDQEAVEDMVVLKEAAGLTDDDVAEALGERAQRVYDKYGTLMLNTEGFSTTGLERKATCRALFQKILFLAECDALIKQGSEAAGRTNLRVIFGATEEDMDKLRIASLHDVDLEAAFNKDSAKVTDDEEEEGPAGSQ